ncbi:MAG: XRE family transcriptional regulator [Oscillospiraceae bacterium]|nr:XRE family transcriptional regulator [Oscillospiraceae bacterium]
MKRDSSAYYPRLEAEMILRHITRLDLKDCIKLKYNTLCKKVNGELRFSLEEAIKIQETYFPDISVNELFRHE